jgi:hypothetical protein
MSPDLEQKLFQKYPMIFADYAAAPAGSLASFGFECGDGWYDLLDTLCAQLSQLPLDKPSDDSGGLRAVQVKEKFGTLRFYVDSASDTAFQLIEFAEAMSARICESCGNRGRTRGRGWVTTLCDVCAKMKGQADDSTDLPGSGQAGTS